MWLIMKRVMLGGFQVYGSSNSIPNIRRSVYSVGCGLGGKLGHGCKNNEGMPKLIEHFQSLSFKPVSISAGTWHAAALGADGLVCTWGWGHTGCLGHGDEEYKAVPTVVEGLRNMKPVHLSTGEYTTFVVTDNGDVYSCGSGESLNLAFQVGSFFLAYI